MSWKKDALVTALVLLSLIGIAFVAGAVHTKMLLTLQAMH